MKVKDKMVRNVVTVNADVSIKEALNLMRTKDCRRLPVLDNKGTLVGIVVEHDIEKVLCRPGGYPETPVSWAMSYKYVFIVNPEDDIVSAAKLMLDKKISSLPVLDEGKIVGIITSADMLQVVIDTYSSIK